MYLIVGRLGLIPVLLTGRQLLYRFFCTLESDSMKSSVPSDRDEPVSFANFCTNVRIGASWQLQVRFELALQRRSWDDGGHASVTSMLVPPQRHVAAQRVARCGERMCSEAKQRQTIVDITRITEHRRHIDGPLQNTPQG
jgi:hypothetical protein